MNAGSGRVSSYRVVHGWPQVPEGHLLGQVSGVGVNAEGMVFVFRRAGNIWLSDALPPAKPIGEPAVMVFEEATGRLAASWGSNMFVMPHGLAIDHQGNVWLTDVARHQVFKFDGAGRLLLTLGESGVPGSDRAHFDKPTDVAVASDGSFYVSDGYGNSRVVKFSGDGKYLLEWGTKGANPGQFDTPHGIALDSRGRVYVADRGNARLQIFDGSGKFLAEWKGPQLGRPWAVAIGADGRIFVVDGGDQPEAPPDRARIVMVDSEGHVLGSFGSFGKYDGQFVWPHDLAISRGGAVYVGDVGLGMRVQKFVTP